jgi:hypothetical protein
MRRLNPSNDVKATSRDPDANAETATNRANNHAHVDDRVTGTVPNGTPTVSKTHRHASPPSSLGEAGGVAEVEVDMADEGVAVAVVVVEATAAHSRATVIPADNLGTGLRNAPTLLREGATTTNGENTAAHPASA